MLLLVEAALMVYFIEFGVFFRRVMGMTLDEVWRRMRGKMRSLSMVWIQIIFRLLNHILLCLRTLEICEWIR